jgi:hypothetical protein
VIINISSVDRIGDFGLTNCSAAKAGIDAMTVTWSKELAGYKIREVAVAPGYTHTEMVAAISSTVPGKIVAQVPLRRLGEVTEVLSAVRFIIKNDFVTGRILEIDRGTTSLDATGTSQAEEGVKKTSFGEASLRHPCGGARAATRATPGKGFFHMFGRGGRQWIFR